MKKLYFVTSNKNKVKEVQEILKVPVEVASLEIDEIQSLDVEEVIRKKAEAAFAILKKPLFVDDVSFEIEAWGGFPGPFIKFIYLAGGYDLLTKMLSSEKNKKAKVIASIGYHDGKRVHIFKGYFFGTLVEKRGDRGWGFDPYMIPDGHKKTFGEMENDLKNKISHRARVLEKFKQFLEKQEK